MLLLEVVEPVVGLTPDRWDLVQIVMGVVLFVAGFLVMVRA